MDKLCKHLWVNQEGCLLCPATWEQMNKEGYVFKEMALPNVDNQRTHASKERRDER